MTDLLHLLDKGLIKAPIKMHSMPSNTRHTAFYLDMLFVMLRPTRNMVLSCYVLLNFALQDNSRKCFFANYSKAYRDLITLISYSYVQQSPPILYSYVKNFDLISCFTALHKKDYENHAQT